MAAHAPANEGKALGYSVSLFTSWLMIRGRLQLVSSACSSGGVADRRRNQFMSIKGSALTSRRRDQPFLFPLMLHFIREIQIQAETITSIDRPLFFFLAAACSIRA